MNNLLVDWPTLLANRPLPLVMGILNVTPDSFSDGGEFLSPERAVGHGLRLVEEGASILDVGGESTRPPRYGLAEDVPVEEEIRRTAPVIEELARRVDVPISIDTRKTGVARAALSAGATIVNDVTALRHDREMPGLVASAGAGVILMHMRGTDPKSMQSNLVYDDLTGEVGAFLAEAAARAAGAGIPADRIAVDPGLGFSKSAAQSLELLRRVGSLAGLGYPVVVGASRKAFVGTFSASRESAPGDRLPGSLACAGFAAAHGASVVRVHDVAETVAYLAICRAIGEARMRE